MEKRRRSVTKKLRTAVSSLSKKLSEAAKKGVLNLKKLARELKEKSKKEKEKEIDTNHKRNIQINIISDVMNNLEAASKAGHRFCRQAILFFSTVRILCGGKGYRALQANLNVPSERTLSRTNKDAQDGIEHFKAGFATSNWKTLRTIYEAVKEANPNIKPTLWFCAEDETRVRIHPGYCERTDCITGYCGVDCKGKCETIKECREDKCCPRVHQCDSYGDMGLFVIGPDDPPGRAYERIKEITETCRKGNSLRVMILNPLDPAWPRLVCGFYDTCMAFSAKKYVAKQWTQVEILFDRILAPVIGPLVGNASDGDPRRRKLMLFHAIKATPDDVKCLCRYDLLEGEAMNGECNDCTMVRYGLDTPSFTMQAWKMTDKEGNFHIRNIMDQDYIHCGKKGINCMHHPSRALCMGPGLYPHFNSITSHMTAASRDKHGLNKGDNSRDRYMAMDWPSVCRLTSPKHLTSLANLSEGRDGLVANPTVRGTLEYLKLMRLYISIFADRTLPHLERVRRAGEVATYLSLWRGYIKATDGLCVKENFITRETYQDMLISCHCAVLIIMAHRDTTPDQKLDLSRTGTDCCEDLFSTLGACVANKRVYSTLEARHSIHNFNLCEYYAAIGHFELPKSTKNRDTHFYQNERDTDISGPEAWSTDAVLKKAWEEGCRKAASRATKHGLRPTHFSRVGWWSRPWERDRKLVPAKNNGMLDSSESEEEPDEGDADDDDGDSDTGDDSDDSDDDRPLDQVRRRIREHDEHPAECDDALGEDDEDGEGIADAIQTVREVVDHGGYGGEGARGPKIYVPHLRKYLHKATVISDLAMGGGRNFTSTDRCIRARQTKREEDGDSYSAPDLQSVEWDVGIDSDVAVRMDGGTVEVGRITRITRMKGKKKKAADYKHKVRLSSDADRDKHYEDGVRFTCHWFKKGAGNTYSLETNQSFVIKDLGPHNIISPVILEHIEGKKWKLNEQSINIVKYQRRGHENIEVANI